MGLSIQTVRKHRYNLQRRVRCWQFCALLFAAVSGGAMLPLTPQRTAGAGRAPATTVSKQLQERLDKAVGGCLVL